MPPQAKTSRTKLGPRGILTLSPVLLEAAGINMGSQVWVISDGDILIIRSISKKHPASYPVFIKQLRGIIKRFLSR
ncbi:MAG: hypothetical protein M1503_13225 [Thaumarchaeota archaeon]|nr:hypothetical protein [Nitrososphaerota archaeon]